jgi:nucleoside-diphosphate-sugar epimerase
MYLITGGAGFIGSHLAEELTRYQQGVRVLDNFSTGRRDNLEAVQDRIEIVRGDVRDLGAVRRAMRGVRYVLHQAALASVPRSVQDPVETSEVNVQGTLNVLVAARDAGVQRVVHASCASVYGDSPHRLQQEDQPPAPVSPYAVAKLAAEQYCRLFARLYGLETVSLRYFNVFGPRQDGESDWAAVIPRFIGRALRGEALDVNGDGLQARDFTYVGDVVQANLLAVKAPNVVGEVFNVGCGESHAVMDVVYLLSKFLGREIRWHNGPPRQGDVRRTQADIGKARRLLGYEVEAEFPVALATTVKSMQATYAAGTICAEEAR